MRLYVIGTEGQVARALREAATQDSEITFGCASSKAVDIRNPKLIEQALTEFSPDIVINPAAYTAVDRAESEPDLAFAVNRDGAFNVATAAARRRIPIVHLSTDYVFDGKSQTDTSKQTMCRRLASMGDLSWKVNMPSLQPISVI